MKRPKYIPYAEEISWAVKEKLFEDEKGRALLRLWKYGLADEEVLAMINYRIRKHQHRELFKSSPFKVPPGGEL